VPDVWHRKVGMPGIFLGMSRKIPGIFVL